MHPWTDIPSEEDWQEICRRCQRPDNPFLTAIRSYHAIKKDNLANFGTRRARLGMLANTVEQTLQRNNHPIGEPNTPGYWFAYLAGRARGKAAYLKRLAEWRFKQKYENRRALLQYLQEAQQNQRENGKYLAAAPYAKMEKLDPFHRYYEFEMDGQGVKAFQDEDFGGSQVMGHALERYFAYVPQQGENPNATFFEWLETQPVCTSTPLLGRRHHAKLSEGVPSVDYDITVEPLGVSGWHLTMMHENKLVKASTRSLPRSEKGPAEGAAFVWSLTEQLFIHSHCGKFVHTCFNGGKKVRCAGMIVIQGGKVTQVTNESGHYQTKPQQLFNFVHWLRKIHVLDRKASVRIKNYAEFLKRFGSESETIDARTFLRKAGLKSPF